MLQSQINIYNPKMFILGVRIKVTVIPVEVVCSEINIGMVAVTMIMRLMLTAVAAGVGRSTTASCSQQ